MKLGLFGINYATCGDPEIAVRVAQAAEAAGLESVWTGEHIVLPDPMGPALAIPPETPMLDTVVAVTLLAAHTTTLRLGTGVIVAPNRNPLILAKELASVDVVSGGRLIVGVGAGYLTPEFEALGVPMDRRGARLDDYIRAMRAIWTEDHPRYRGEFASFAGVNAYPRPIQQPLPIHIGGENQLAYRRAVTMAEGWYGFGLDLDETRQCLAGIREVTKQWERPANLGELELSVTPIGPFDRRSVEAYADLGIDRLILLPQPDVDRTRRHAPVPVDDILRTIDMAGSITGRM